MNTARAEHPIDQLADSEIQAATSKVAHRLARRVPQHGGPNDRFRERLLRSVHRAPLPSDHEHEPKLLRPHLQGSVPQLCTLGGHTFRSLTRTFCRSTRTCVAHNSAMQSTKPNSSSAARSSHQLHRAQRQARRLPKTKTTRVLPPRSPTERCRTARGARWRQLSTA